MAILLGLATFGLLVYFGYQYFVSLQWHFFGAGERKARAEFGRLSREEPNSPDAKLSEAEFVQRYVGHRAGVMRYIMYALLVTLIGLPLTCYTAARQVLHK